MELPKIKVYSHMVGVQIDSDSQWSEIYIQGGCFQCCFAPGFIMA